MIFKIISLGCLDNGLNVFFHELNTLRIRLRLKMGSFINVTAAYCGTLAPHPLPLEWEVCDSVLQKWMKIKMC